MDNTGRNNRREALKRLDSLMPANPLEVLMVSEDLVRTLQAEELKPIVKAIGNVFIRELHPDTTTDTTTTTKRLGKFSIEQVLLAVDDYNENPEKLRREFLDTFSKKSKGRLNKKPTGAEIIPIDPIESSSEIFDSFYSEKSVLKLKNATVLLNTISLNSFQRYRPPLQSLTVKNNKVSLRPVKYYENDFTDQERKQIIKSIPDIPPGEDSTAFYVSNEGLTVIASRAQEVFLTDNEYPELLQEGWWYKIIGISRDTEETRSIMSYKPLATQQSVKLLGSIPLNVANTVTYSLLHGPESDNKPKPALKSGANRSSTNLKWKNFIQIPETTWVDLIRSTSSNNQLIFKPYLMPHHVLIGENKDKNKIIIGETSFISAEYY